MRELISKIIGVSLTLLLVSGYAWAGKSSVGFIYVGPVGDGGWTHAHDLGRKALEEAGHKTYFVESVPEGASEGQEALSAGWPAPEEAPRGLKKDLSWSAVTARGCGTRLA